MTIQILGTGCPKCRLLKQNASKAIDAIGPQDDIQLEEITDMDTMMEMGMLVSPGLAIDGELLQMGKVLSAEQIQNIILERGGTSS